MQLNLFEVFVVLSLLLPSISSQELTEDKKSFQVEFPVLGTDANITCGGRAIEVTVSQAYLQRNKQWLNQGQWLTLYEPKCRAKLLSNGDAFIKVEDDFTDCGNRISVMETVSSRGEVKSMLYKFSNILITDNGNNMVSRQIELLKFDCIYPATQLMSTVDSQVNIHVIQLDKLNGEMVVHKSKSLMTSSDFSQSSEDNDLISVQITVNEPQLSGIGNASFDFVAVVERCWIAFETDNLPSNISLIADGCPVHESVQISSNGESLTGRFTIQMFSFLTTGADPVLHCMVKICNRTSPNGCLPTCGSRRKRRSFFEIEESEKITIFIKSSPQEMMSKLPSVNETLVYTTNEETNEIKNHALETITGSQVAVLTSKPETPTKMNISQSLTNSNEKRLCLIAFPVGIGLLLIVIGAIVFGMYKFRKGGMCKFKQQKRVHA